MFNHVQKTPEWCGRIVSEKSLETDVATDMVPQYVYYTPNMKNDGHDTNVGYAANWLDLFLKSKMASNLLTKRTLFFVTFDESEVSRMNRSSKARHIEAIKNIENATNRVYAVLFGEPVHLLAGTIDRSPYTHYSLLRTVEENWSLGSLGREDAKSTAFGFRSA